MAKPKITGDFNMRMPEIIPFFVEGKDAKAVYDALKGLTSGTMGYDEKTQTFYGSTPFVAAKIDTLVRPFGLRLADVRDLSRPEVMAMIKNRHYTDAPAFVLRSMNDSNSRNLPLIKRIAEEVERVNGKVQFPVLITGFDVKPLQDEGYGIDIVPRDNFTAVYDERLNGENNGKKFSDVDELGLPKFDKGGERTFLARNQGLSRLFVDGNLDLYSYIESLASSSGDGRVVLIRGEAVAEKFAQSYQKQLKANFGRLQERAKTEYELKLERLQAVGKELGL